MSVAEPQPCPNCGYCPTCKRARPVYPVSPYPWPWPYSIPTQPWWQNPYPNIGAPIVTYVSNVMAGKTVDPLCSGGIVSGAPAVNS